MNKLSRAARAQALQWLCKGINIKATTRRTGVSITALLRLVGDSGRAASWYQDRVFRNLNSKKIEINALWGFKDPNVRGAKKGGSARAMFGFGLLPIHRQSLFFPGFLPARTRLRLLSL